MDIGNSLPGFDEATAVAAAAVGGGGEGGAHHHEAQQDGMVMVVPAAVATDTAATIDPSTATRKRPPEVLEGGMPNQRPRMEAEAVQPSAASGAGGVSSPTSRLQEAADGIINLAATAHVPDGLEANLFDPPGAAASAAAGAAPVGSHDVSNLCNHSVVHLSITKSRPSFTEPWRKFPPESAVGTGVAIAWNDASANKMGNEGVSAANEEMSAANEFKSPEPLREGDAVLGNGGGKHPGTKQAGDAGNDTNGKEGMRILTNARAVQHATSIRVCTASSPISVGCTVEWMSLAMDLALLKVAGHLHAVLLPVNDSLLCVGEEVTCVGFSPSGAVGAASASMQRWRPSRRAEADVQRGVVAGFYADGEEHHLLRMKVNWLNACSGSSGGGGGVVLGGNGHVVGLFAGPSSETPSTGVRGIIPGPVLDRFLRMCCGCTSSPEPHLQGASCGVHGESSAETSRDTGDETSGSRAKPAKSAKQTKPNASGIKHLPGITTLGITGFQPLENTALRRSLGLSDPASGIPGDCGVRILGISHTVHPNNDNEFHSAHCKEDKKCHTSLLRTDDVLLALDGEPIRLDGTARLAPGRDNERVDFRWLVSRRPAGSEVKLDVVRQGKRMEIHAALKAPTYLVPRREEGDDMPSYVICGGCVFVPLTRAWLSETMEKQSAQDGSGSLPPELQGFRRYLQEQRRGDQQVIVLSHVLADEVNVGYHGMRNMILTAVNGQRPVTNMQHLVELLVKKESQSLEFRCACVHKDRAKVVVCVDAKEAMDSETRIMNNYMIDSWCSNALSPGLRKEAEGKAHRHGVTCGLKTMRALRNSVRETTLVVRRPVAVKGDDSGVVAATRRIMDFSEAHKMQSAPLFAGKYTEEGGWTQVKTKHLSQLCACGKSTRFYCICTVGVMRCKDCFLQHCRDHTSQHECSEHCAPNCEAVEVLAEGVELVTTKKRKRNNPTQAIQSRCVVCKAKTCYCCSACGFEKELALCHVSTGRNCLAIHTSELHNTKSSLAV